MNYMPQFKFVFVILIILFSVSCNGSDSENSENNEVVEIVEKNDDPVVCKNPDRVFNCLT